MDYQTYYNISESSLTFGFWFSIVLASVFCLIGISILVKKPPEMLFGGNRIFHLVWAVFAICISGFLVYFLINSVLNARNSLSEGKYEVIESSIVDFKTIKRNSDLFEFTLLGGATFKTSGMTSQVPRTGLPIGTNVRVTYNVKNEILKLEIENGQYMEIQKQLEKYKHECFNYAKC